MGTIFCYFIAYILEAITIQQYCSTLFFSRHSKITPWISVFICYAILFAVSFLEIFPLNMISFILLNFIFIISQYEVRPQSAFFHTIIATVFMGLSELIVAGTFPNLTQNCYNEPTYFRSLLILLIFAKQLYLWTLYIISRLFKKSEKLYEGSRKEILLLTTIPLISAWILITLLAICYYVTISNILHYMIAGSAIFLLFINLIIWGIYIYTVEKNHQFTDLQLQLQKETEKKSHLTSSSFPVRLIYRQPSASVTMNF